ncbi:Terminase-like family protein [Poriferisphaera corsica]|uniref:Terminase-like family protein n=2 Tax=Poriferisphaera corsica TaxID=2528020 RepID=A0A517YZA9_9BACT|nr:Terminase-like family protein [Poriferisphaera corsica]
MSKLAIEKIREWGRLGQLYAVRPRDEDELHLFVKVVLGLNVPREARYEGNDGAFEYVKWAYFEGSPPIPPTEREVLGADAEEDASEAGNHGCSKHPSTGGAGLDYDVDKNAPNDVLDDMALRTGSGMRSEDKANEQGGDCVVWANRGGGKTMLGAVVTLLDLMFKPGIQVRILGGSLEQSGRMYEHLLGLLERPMLKGIVKGEPTQRKIELVNGSRVEILAQSQRSVRGVRVHKLRCDEVEEFDKDVWEAAQLVTRSGWCGDVWVKGRVEALSTMHRAGGLMGRLVSQGWQVFRWNAIDVMQRCDRECEGCVLADDCGGKGKKGEGFVGVDDLVDQWRRTSLGTWESEMMCRKPRLDEMVYPMFERGRHVTRKLEIEKIRGEHALSRYVIGGMDFGIRSLAVVLTAEVYELEDGKQVVHVVDEVLVGGMRLEKVVKKWEEGRANREIDWPRWMGVDPAGVARNMQTGLSDVAVLEEAGYVVRTGRVRMREGIELVRKMLDKEELYVHPRCVGLIEAMEGYHFDRRHVGSEEPVKDGSDHACDAMRYMLQNLVMGKGKKVAVGRY